MINLNGNQDDEMQQKNTKLKYAAATKMLEEAYTEKLEDTGTTSKPSVGSISNTHQTSGHEFNTKSAMQYPQSQDMGSKRSRYCRISSSDTTYFVIDIQKTSTVPRGYCRIYSSSLVTCISTAEKGSSKV